MSEPIKVCRTCGSRKAHDECKPADVKRWQAYGRRVDAYHASPAFAQDMARNARACQPQPPTPALQERLL